MKYVVDESVLRKKCKKVSTHQGRIIGDNLIRILKENNDGIGLAANQVGIDAAVCVVCVDKPMIFVNPKIVGKFGKSYFQEACLSVPGEYIITERWTDIVVVDDLSNDQRVFSFEKNALECVCVQHEIDHLNGILMLDRAIEMEIFNGK